MDKKQAIKQIRQETLEELNGLYGYWDDGFIVKGASPDAPLKYPVVRAIWHMACDALCEADSDYGLSLWEDERRNFLAWFKEQATEILWDRVSKIDWEAKKLAKEALQKILSESLGLQ